MVRSDSNAVYIAAAAGSNFALLSAPGFEYELALAFLRRDRPGSKEPPLRGDEKRATRVMKNSAAPRPPNLLILNSDLSSLCILHYSLCIARVLCRP